MKKINFVEIEGICPLNTEELTHTFGGSWWSDFKEGFTQGWNWAKKGLAEITAILVLGNKIRNM